MQSSYRIFRLFGVSVELHITFIIIFLLFLFGATFYGLIDHQGPQLFSIDAEFVNELNNTEVSNKLINLFNQTGYPLSKHARIDKLTEGKWMILDEESSYIINKEDEQLGVYQESVSLTQGALNGVRVFAIFLLLFGTVLIHEFSHSLVALRNNIRVPKITLTPIGGAANIDVPENPKLEFKLSIAGPMSNFILLLLSLIILFIFWPDFLLTTEFINYFDIGNSEVTYFYLNNIFRDILLIPNIFAITAVMNFLLGTFNLIPAFPMDGGRVLRSILALGVDYVEATKIAVQIGQIIAVLMFITGLMYGPILILISLFILITGSNELRIVRMRHILHGMTLRDIVIPNVVYVDESTTVKEFLNSTASPQQEYYPVTDYNRKVTGVLNINDLREINQTDFDKTPVSKLAKRRLNVVDANLKVEKTLITLLTKEFILVVDSKKVIGYLTPEHLSGIVRFYGIQREIKHN